MSQQVRFAYAISALLFAACSPALPSTNEALFRSDDAQRATKEAPDLVAAAERSWDVAAELEAAKQIDAAADYRERSRLLIAAAIVETERVELQRRLDAVRNETRQLIYERDVEQLSALRLEHEQQRALTVTSTLENATRARALAVKADAGRASRKERDLVSRVLLDRASALLSVALALGASPSAVETAAKRRSALQSQKHTDPESVEILLWDVYRLTGHARARQPEPSVGAGESLLRSAADFSMQAERRNNGTEIWVRLRRRARADARTIRRMGMLLDAFPHGPVACRVFGVRARAWRRMQDDFGPLEETRGGRVTLEASIEPSEEQELRCTFTGYTQP